MRRDRSALPDRGRAASRSVIFGRARRRTVITGVRAPARRSVRTIIMHIRCRQEDRVRVIRIMANLRVADVKAAKSFYTGYLGLSTEEFNMGGWPATPLPIPGPECS